jgi:hypothetical protein
MMPFPGTLTFQPTQGSVEIWLRHTVENGSLVVDISEYFRVVTGISASEFEVPFPLKFSKIFKCFQDSKFRLSASGGGIYRSLEHLDIVVAGRAESGKPIAGLLFDLGRPVVPPELFSGRLVAVREQMCVLDLGVLDVDA